MEIKGWMRWLKPISCTCDIKISITHLNFIMFDAYDSWFWNQTDVKKVIFTSWKKMGDISFVCNIIENRDSSVFHYSISELEPHYNHQANEEIYIWEIEDPGALIPFHHQFKINISLMFVIETERIPIAVVLWLERLLRDLEVVVLSPACTWGTSNQRYNKNISKTGTLPEVHNQWSTS